MKRKIVLSFVLAVALALATSGMASADLLAHWNYNTYTADNSTTAQTDTNQTPKSPYADAGILTGTAQQVWYNDADLGAWGYNDGLQPRRGAGTVQNPYTYPGDWSVDPAGNTATTHADDRRYRFVMNALNEGLRWNVSTANYEDIQIELGIFTGTNWTSSPRSFSLEYSTNGGNSWSTNSISYTGNDVWKPLSLDLRAITAADNNSTFAFRLISDGTTADTLTVDYVNVTGTQIVPIPAAAWLLGSGLLGLVAMRRRMKK